MELLERGAHAPSLQSSSQHQQRLVHQAHLLDGFEVRQLLGVLLQRRDEAGQAVGRVTGTIIKISAKVLVFDAGIILNMFLQMLIDVPEGDLEALAALVLADAASQVEALPILPGHQIESDAGITRQR